MEIREAYREEIWKLAALGAELGATGLPSLAELLELRESPREILLLALSGPEILGFVVASIEDRDASRVGLIRSLACKGPGAYAIESALLTRLEEKLKGLGAAEVYSEESREERLARLLERGYAVVSSVLPREPEGRGVILLARRLRGPEPPWARSGPAGREKRP